MTDRTCIEEKAARAAPSVRACIVIDWLAVFATIMPLSRSLAAACNAAKCGRKSTAMRDRHRMRRPLLRNVRAEAARRYAGLAWRRRGMKKSYLQACW